MTTAEILGLIVLSIFFATVIVLLASVIVDKWGDDDRFI